MSLEEHFENNAPADSESPFSYEPVVEEAVSFMTTVSTYVVKLVQTYNTRFDRWYEKQRLRAYWQSRHSHKTL